MVQFHQEHQPLATLAVQDQKDFAILFCSINKGNSARRQQGEVRRPGMLRR